MAAYEIMVNCFRNTENKIDLDLDNKKVINTLIIKGKDIEIEEESWKKKIYNLNNISNNNIGDNIINLKFKNIIIDLSKSNIQFNSLQTLSINDSIIIISTNNNYINNLQNLEIKGDLNIIKENLLNIKNNNISLNQITLKIISKSSSKTNIFNLLKSLSTFILQLKDSINIYFKDLLDECDINKIEKPNNEILSKIKKIYLFSLNKLSISTSKIIKEELIDKLNNLEEFYLNENIECNLENKLKLISIINNNEDININYNLYDINKLNIISLPICEYNKAKKTLLLYGEANMSFYNPNNKELLLNIIQNNHNGNIFLLSLCNFDMENIDYLIELINYVNNVQKINIENLNINDEFIKTLKNKKLFNSECISINNIIFVDDDVENNFYELINGYNNCKYLKLISLESIDKYSDIIIKDNLNKLYLEEIYDMNYELLKNLILKKNTKFSEITLKNLEISEDNNKNIIIEIISYIKDEIKKLKIIGPDFNFIYKEFQNNHISFQKLEKLILHIDKDDDNENNEKSYIKNDLDKIMYLENNYKLLNYCGIKKIDIGMFSINLNHKAKIMNLYKKLYEIY